MKKNRQANGIIFRATITLRDGRVIRAADYGKRAFPIRIRAR